MERYPKEYFILFEMAAKKPINIACDSPEQAMSIRNDLYTFRSALKDWAKDDYQMHALCRLAHTVSLSITDRTITAKPI